MRPVPAGLTLLMLLAPLAAQDPAWRLPARGAAEYRRTRTEATVTAASKRAVLAAAAGESVPEHLLPRLVMPAWLCQGELAADQRAVGDEPRDLRDLVRAVAFDLRLQKNVKVRYLRLVPFGDLVLTGRVDAADAAGGQRFTLDVATEEPQVRPGEGKASLRQHVRPLCRHAAVGTLQVTRRFDGAAGVVASFAVELTLVFEEDGKAWRKLVLRDAWELVAVHDNQDAAFRAAVADAIVKGAKWVRERLQADALQELRDDEEEDRSYGSGRIALALLTLLHAEVPGDDPLVTAAFDELRRRELVDTYSLGIGLMALAARHAPPNEREQLRTGALAAPAPRQLPAADRALAARWLARLQQNVDTRVDPGNRLRFNYVADARWDNSVNQYGLLGLWSAKLCQLDVPSELWRAAASHLIEFQGDDGGRSLRLSLTTHRELARTDDAAARTRGSAGAVPARGFAYEYRDRPPYGSMTTAGIAGLVLARAGMHASGQQKAEVLPKVDAGVAAGFAWLAAEFHVRSNPGHVDRRHDHWYYYLYGLERACELAGIALLQDRDWYYEGALQLLAQQQANGTFTTEHAGGREIETTCFAILFLKKATLPAVTGG
ncbi:MAG: hypothetical protein JNL08_00500 [Planctomycetes bacterium]|nr:hypothetical protein [Planctomycetota bacterium]